MKNKWIITLVIMNIVLIISLISVISIWLFDKKDENQITSTQQEKATKEDATETTKSSDDSEIINTYNSKYASIYDLVVSIETDSNYISQVKKVMVNLSIVKLDEMNKNNKASEVDEIMKNVRNDIIKDFGQVSVSFRAGQENKPFYMFDTDGNGHQIN